MANKIIIPNADFSSNAAYKEGGVTPITTTLVNGFASRQNNTTVNVDSSSSAMSIRVRTGELYGAFHVKVKSGYLIRSIIYYDTSIDYSTSGSKTSSGVTEAVGSTQNLTEYTLSVTNKYACITFCKTNASTNISPTEDIVDELYYI